MNPMYLGGYPKYINILEIIKKCGTDLRKFDLTGVKLVGDLRDVKLPDDNLLFQKVYDKNISGVRLPEKDYSNYDFANVCIVGTRFTKFSKLPQKRYLFQIIREKSLFATKLPEADYSIYNFFNVILSSTKFTEHSKLPKERNLFKYVRDGISDVTMPLMDYSNYDFTNVNLVGTIFPKKSKLPNDIEFFQKIHSKNLSYAILPEGDYSKCNFSGVGMLSTTFSKNSSLPEKYSFFEELSFYDKRIKLPKTMLENIHYYDIKFVGDNILTKLPLNKIFLMQNKSNC